MLKKKNGVSVTTLSYKEPYGQVKAFGHPPKSIRIYVI